MLLTIHGDGRKVCCHHGKQLLAPVCSKTEQPQEWACESVTTWVTFQLFFLQDMQGGHCLSSQENTLKTKECYYLACPPQEAVPPGADQNACVQLLQQPWCVRPLHQASAPGPEDKDNSAAAKVFHVLHMLLKTACSPAVHT